MGFMFSDLHVSLNNPSSGDINSSNLPCLKYFQIIKMFLGRLFQQYTSQISATLMR